MLFADVPPGPVGDPISALLIVGGILLAVGIGVTLFVVRRRRRKRDGSEA